MKTKDTAPVVDRELEAIEHQDAELRELEAQFFKLRNAHGVADNQRKSQQLFVERLRSDGQALLGVSEEEFTAHERSLRELLRTEAKAKNELHIFVEAHPDLDRQRQDLNARRSSCERDAAVRQLGDRYFSEVQPAIAAAIRLLIDHQLAKNALGHQYQGLTIPCMGPQIQGSPFSPTLNFEDVASYLEFERLYHRREELSPSSSARAVAQLHESEVSGWHKVTKPRWTW